MATAQITCIDVSDELAFESLLKKCDFIYRHASEVISAIPDYGFDDALQELRTHLWISAKKYRTDRGASLESFLFSCSKNKRNEIIRKHTSVTRGSLVKIDSLDEEIDDQDLRSVSMYDVVSDYRSEDLDSLEVQDILRVVLGYIESVHDDLFQQVILYYLQGMKQKELAQKFQISQSNVSEKINRFRAAVDVLLTEEGYTEEELHPRSLKFKDPKGKK